MATKHSQAASASNDTATTEPESSAAKPEPAAEPGTTATLTAPSPLEQLIARIEAYELRCSSGGDPLIGLTEIRELKKLVVAAQGGVSL